MFSTEYEAINIAITNDDSPDETSGGAQPNFAYDGDDDGDGSELLDTHYHHIEDQITAKVKLAKF